MKTSGLTTQDKDHGATFDLVQTQNIVDETARVRISKRINCKTTVH